MQVTVVGVKFKQNGKIYFFEPKDFNLNIGDGVLVETARGLEFGEVASHIKKVDETSIVSPLKPVIRVATKKDISQHKNNLKKADEALKITLALIEQLKLDMQVVDVEYVFDASKVIISFTSDNRVDFRELVKELATKLKTRIELRQIGIRDKSKVVGGIGICGKECCCKIYLNDFEKVSIKMAKTQGLSLNPSKISGLCGRLMCCLEYENPYYSEVSTIMPKINSQIDTPDGKGVVVYQNYLKQTVSVKIESSEGVFVFKDYELKDLGLEQQNSTQQQKKEQQKEQFKKNTDSPQTKEQNVQKNVKQKKDKKIKLNKKHKGKIQKKENENKPN